MAMATSKVETVAKEKQKKKLDDKVASRKNVVAKQMHFVPVPLLVTVLLCSGLLVMLSFRDFFSTGKVILGPMDEAMLHFTKSMKWFDDSKGWKSSQGGFSAVRPLTTDENDMGGFFIRKVGGAVALAFNMQKLFPMLVQSSNTHWGKGHFNPMLVTSAICNLAIASFYISNLEDLKAGGAHDMGFVIIFVLVIESFVMVGYAMSALLNKSTNMAALPVELQDGKTASSVVCKIAARTVSIISGMTAIIAGRDFFFPGQELPFPPRDDMYLEWTGAFIHSPPPFSEESEEHGLEAPLHTGNKFMSRLMALYFLVICFQKFVSCFLIRVGKDNSGLTKCKIFWKYQAIGNLFVLFAFRVFGPAAKTASFDVRWHLMCIAYEAFILGIYGFAS